MTCRLKLYVWNSKKKINKFSVFLQS